MPPGPGRATGFAAASYDAEGDFLLGTATGYAQDAGFSTAGPRGTAPTTEVPGRGCSL